MNTTLWAAVVSCLGLGLAAPFAAHAQQSPGARYRTNPEAQSWAARVVVVWGDVKVTRNSSGGLPHRQYAWAGTYLQAGDNVHTGDNARARVLLRDQSVIEVSANTRFTVKSADKNATKIRIKLFLGRLWARVVHLSNKPRTFEVETANAVAGVRGTSFVVVQPKDHNRPASITVLHGTVQSLHTPTRTQRILTQHQQQFFTPRTATRKFSVASNAARQIQQRNTVASGFRPNNALGARIKAAVQAAGGSSVLAQVAVPQSVNQIPVDGQAVQQAQDKAGRTAGHTAASAGQDVVTPAHRQLGNPFEQAGISPGAVGPQFEPGAAVPGAIPAQVTVTGILVPQN